MVNSNLRGVIAILNLYRSGFIVMDSNGKVVFESEKYKYIENNVQVVDENIYYDEKEDQYYEYQTKSIVIDQDCYDIATFTDVTRFEKEIIKGQQDQVTMLPNRNMIENICHNHDEQKTIFVLCDIDDFKLINDTFGHPTGDYVLRKIGMIFKSNILENNFVGRYGGEEFLMMFSTSLEEVLALLKKIRNEIEEGIELTADRPYKVQFSSGIAVYDGSISIDEIIKKADQALYYVKNHGKNKNAIYCEEKKDYQLL